MVNPVFYRRRYVRYNHHTGARIQMEPLKKLENRTIVATVDDLLIKVLLEAPFRLVGRFDDFVAGRKTKPTDESVESNDR